MVQVIKVDFRNKTQAECVRRYRELQSKQYEKGIQYFDGEIKSGRYTDSQVDSLRKVIMTLFKEVTLINNELEK